MNNDPFHGPHKLWPGPMEFTASPWALHTQAHFVPALNLSNKSPTMFQRLYMKASPDVHPLPYGMYPPNPPTVPPQPVHQTQMYHNGCEPHPYAHIPGAVGPQQYTHQSQPFWNMQYHTFNTAQGYHDSRIAGPGKPHPDDLAEPHLIPPGLPISPRALAHNDCTKTIAAVDCPTQKPLRRDVQSSPSHPRGPPRKPRRSGFAVWVGNIPSGASIHALKDHFSRDASGDIESVFLMSKSNCAFVNYRTEAACDAAVERHNHSLFGAVRLLCRLRRDTLEQHQQQQQQQRNQTADTSGDRNTPVDEDGADPDRCPVTIVGRVAALNIDSEDGAAIEPIEKVPSKDVPSGLSSADRYFILKSLTKEDLQESLQRGTWETQTHNQRSLDEAFRNSENVYLIFSVNRSGEYFGYARMTTSPYDESPPVFEYPMSTASPSKFTNPYHLNVTSTEATQHAPAGCIVSDSSRGTLFWESKSAPTTLSDGDVSASFSSESEVGVTSNAGKSRPFGVEWLSVRRVTFQRTKGIRNPWNSGKEVKVARDGTELETGIGKTMVALFHEN